MNTCVYLVLLINVVSHVTGQESFIEDYYWRDYEGILPADAIPGGSDANGKPIYIGQVLFENKLIPGKIYENDDHIYFHWGAERKANTNIKVLCSQSPHQFEWLATKHDEVVRLTDRHLVKGGSQADYFTYIGRAYSAGETTIGKVICHVTNCLGMYVTKDGRGAEHKQPFEILSYNYSISSSS